MGRILLVVNKKYKDLTFTLISTFFFFFLSRVRNLVVIRVRIGATVVALVNTECVKYCEKITCHLSSFN